MLNVNIEDVLTSSYSDYLNEFEKQVEAHIIEKFGSVDEFKKVAHLYVLEDYLSVDSKDDEKNNSYSIVYTINWRLRQKTLEERVADNWRDF